MRVCVCLCNTSLKAPSKCVNVRLGAASLIHGKQTKEIHAARPSCFNIKQKHVVSIKGAVSEKKPSRHPDTVMQGEEKDEQVALASV